MKCPTDSTVLQITERQGIEIDYCPTCRGVWLDRGELDKIIDRAQGALRPDSDARTRDDRRRYDDTYEDRYECDDDRNDDDRAFAGGRRKRKRGGFLGDLFEFGE